MQTLSRAGRNGDPGGRQAGRGTGHVGAAAPVGPGQAGPGTLTEAHGPRPEPGRPEQLELVGQSYREKGAMQGSHSGNCMGSPRVWPNASAQGGSDEQPRSPQSLQWPPAHREPSLGSCDIGTGPRRFHGA